MSSVIICIRTKFNRDTAGQRSHALLYTVMLLWFMDNLNEQTAYVSLASSLCTRQIAYWYSRKKGTKYLQVPNLPILVTGRLVKHDAMCTDFEVCLPRFKIVTILSSGR
jgi:hypothetical protein